jgi:MOSC domain-containing protein YiiM
MPQLGMSAGGMGENLTLAGIDETIACIGDRFTVADCELEICQPRQPCWKISRRWADKTMTKRVAQTGRTGWYVRVIRGGTIRAGDELTLTHRPNPTWTVARVNDVLVGREVDRMAAIELINLPELSDEWKKDIA